MTEINDINQIKYDDKSPSNINSIKKFFIQHPDKINNQNNINKMTPLYFAILYNNSEIAKCLIQKGADINLATTSLNFTPLRIALIKNNYEIAILLLKQRNIDVNVIAKKNFKSLVQIALEQYKIALEPNNNESQFYLIAIIKLLIKNGAYLTDSEIAGIHEITNSLSYCIKKYKYIRALN